MTVQISVTIWTVICFLALMLILDRLLFRPLLDLMDKRREKIDGTRAARRSAQQEREEELLRREQERLAEKKQAMLDASAALEAMREENARRLAERKAENARRLEQERQELEKESLEIISTLEPRTESLDEILAYKLHHSSYRELLTKEEDATAAPRAEVSAGPAEEAAT